MASLQQESTGIYHVVFRFKGRRFKRSLETKTGSIAESRKQEIEETLDLLKRDRISVPSGIRDDEYILAGGQVSRIVDKNDDGRVRHSRSLTIKGLFKEFFDALPDDSLEPNTLRTMRTHERHLLRVLKSNTSVQELRGHELQKYINLRSKEKTQYIETRAEHPKPYRRPVSGTTIKKEIVTLGIVWRWAVTASLLTGQFPSRGLRYPKADEKPPFRTFDEISHQIKSLSLIGTDASELWDCLYLSSGEICDLLDEVKKRQTDLPVYGYTMIVTAAHTGARRSELLRAQRSDINFGSNTITIREKKRVRGSRSTRRVPISPTLRETLRVWFENHPGGTSLFCESDQKPILPAESQRLIRRALMDSKWSVVKGWHALRHSFISNLACKNIDQRLIDEFVGHTTEEMRRRYRHLFPDIKQSAIETVFGKGLH